MSEQVQVEAQFSHTKVFRKGLTDHHRIMRRIFVQWPTLIARSSVIDLKEKKEEIHHVDIQQKKEATYEEKGRILSMLNDGSSFDEIVLAFGVSPSFVSGKNPVLLK